MLKKVIKILGILIAISGIFFIIDTNIGITSAVIGSSLDLSFNIILSLVCLWVGVFLFIAGQRDEDSELEEKVLTEADIKKIKVRILDNQVAQTSSSLPIRYHKTIDEGLEKRDYLEIFQAGGGSKDSYFIKVGSSKEAVDLASHLQSVLVHGGRGTYRVVLKKSWEKRKPIAASDVVFETNDRQRAVNMQIALTTENDKEAEQATKDFSDDEKDMIESIRLRNKKFRKEGKYPEVTNYEIIREGFRGTVSKVTKKSGKYPVFDAYPDLKGHGMLPHWNAVYIPLEEGKHKVNLHILIKPESKEDEH